MPFFSGGGGGGAAFNGGTITETLTVEPPTGHKGVVVVGVDGDTTKLLDLSALHTAFTVDSDGFVHYTSDDTPALYVEATTGSTAHLNVFDDSGGLIHLRSDTGLYVILDYVGMAEFSSSKFMLHYNAAPIDDDLLAGDCALWFDQTNGAAALNIKAKQANGTVKTATIPVIT